MALSAVGSSPPKETTVSDVLARWASSGPLIHQATGFASLDSRTGGGPVYGSRWYVMGAPDACKTLFLAQLGHQWSMQEITVGILAVDEEDEDVVTRLVQRTMIQGKEPMHFTRQDCEKRETSILDLMKSSVGTCSISFFEAQFTIEMAASRLAEIAHSRGQRSVLLIDSIQTVECDASRKAKVEVSLREKITGNTKAVRAVSTRHKMLVISTCEMNRPGYRQNGGSDQNDMAAAKESGAIEYSARVLLALRSVPDEDDCIECKIVKNKHGPSFPASEAIYFRLDRHRQSLAEREPPESVTDQSPVNRVCKAVFEAQGRGGASSEEVRIATHLSKPRCDYALRQAEMAKLIRRVSGPKSHWVLVEVDPDGSDCP